MLLTFLRIKGAREAGLPRTGGWPAKLETLSPRGELIFGRAFPPIFD